MTAYRFLGINPKSSASTNSIRLTMNAKPIVCSATTNRSFAGRPRKAS